MARNGHLEILSGRQRFRERAIQFEKHPTPADRGQYPAGYTVQSRLFLFLIPFSLSLSREREEGNTIDYNKSGYFETSPLSRIHLLVTHRFFRGAGGELPLLLRARRRKGEEDGKMDTSINVARSCGCIRLLSHRALLEACGKRERKMYIYGEREREGERVYVWVSTRLPSPPLAEFLPLPLLRRLSPIDNTATEIFLHVYGSCICKISMSPLLLLLSSFVLHFVVALSAPFLQRSFLNPRNVYIYIYNVRAIKTFVFYILVGKVGGPGGIYVVNKAFSTVRLFFFQEYFPKIGLNRLSLLFCRFDNAMIIEKGIGIRNRISLFTRAFYGFLM